MIVVDTNIIAYLLLSGEHSDKAAKALRREPVWAVPLLWRSELHNVMALYIRKSVLTVSQAVMVIDRADELINGREFTVSTRSVLELVEHSNCSAYDCEFVALAHDLSAPLLTADRRILDQFPEVAISLERYVASEME